MPGEKGSLADELCAATPMFQNELVKIRCEIINLNHRKDLMDRRASWRSTGFEGSINAPASTLFKTHLESPCQSPSPVSQSGWERNNNIGNKNHIKF